MASRRILNYGGGTRCGKMSALSYRALFKHWHSLSVLEIISNIYVNSSFYDFCFGKVLPLFNGANHKVRRVFNGASHDFRRMFNCCRHMISGANHDFRRMFNGANHKIRRMFNGASHKYTHPFLFPLSLIGGSL